MNDSIDSQQDTATDTSVDTTVDTQTTDADEASFNAGFAKVRGNEPPTDTKPAVDTDDRGTDESAAVADSTAVAAPVEEQQSKEPEAPVAPQYISADELKRLEDRFALDQQKIYGKFGDIQRTLNAIKQQAPGQSARLTKESLKKLGAEFPEVAELLADDLGEFLKSPASSIDQNVVEALVADRLKAETERIELQAERKLLTVQHRDWEKVVNDDQFKQWTATLPPDVAQMVATTRDSMFLADAITAFKQARADAAKADTAKSAAAEAATKRKNKLEAAVVPSGVPAARPSKLPDELGLEAGFKRVRSK